MDAGLEFFSVYLRRAGPYKQSYEFFLAHLRQASQQKKCSYKRNKSEISCKIIQDLGKQAIPVSVLVRNPYKQPLNRNERVIEPVWIPARSRIFVSCIC